MLVQDSKKLEVKDKKVLLVGIARSGVATAKFLVEKGAGVVLTDRKPAAELAAALAEVPVDSGQVVAGGYPEYKAGDFDFLVVSPGAPLTVPPVRRAFELGVPVYSELELAYRFAVSPIVAVTGTNGKTTTTTLLGEIFKRAGKRVCVGGNIGLPLVLEVEKYGPEDIIVAEVSSFQLECVDRFKPRVSLILNFTPDHLDRHGTMAAYLAAKARIFANQEAGDFTVLNYDDPEVAGLGAKTRAGVIFFSRRHKLKEGVFVEDGQITVSLGGITERVCPVREVLIKGAHNLENALAAAGAATVMGVAAGATAGSAYVLGQVINKAYIDKNVPGIAILSGVTVLLLFLKGVSTYGHTVILSKISNAILSASLPAMFAAITRAVAARKRA